MALAREKIMAFLWEAFPEAEIDLKDSVGDSNHFAVTIISKTFSGKTKIEQHKMVYDALQGHMGTSLHALSLKTQIPTE
ncbi:MAG: BolA/YrbA family protein [uncultured bacterium]|nr:MAG: BolA/YrbA family protein [uncultured bacterium]OFW68434.1 MAG: ATP-binding protein [Alphaproteobacteria bacterium GWC2_42_16]OFW72966.1 MAG: ATP-binding protein [Alphaproteobacteria bacterium GWA2_41_27]OFW81526.1 MAG: ATP-binding protein [Alphaproteobacteria bacterium RIFCSPHIGHO2_12_FULL_42_100]OFW86778.1 MAG: ATP-binding protein [Alphaproteobacteria bacterium RBG_16_42_14]OFW90452.1 MAG: ATP-binding protein [Alphaproteobacteria bacterium RIFCSPHIGHO2_02_FULL_42_30]OFW92352.1 MAG: A